MTKRPSKPTTRPPRNAASAALDVPAARGTRPRVEHPTPVCIREIVRPPGQPRMRARGTPRTPVPPGEQLSALIFAPEATRAEWIEAELSRAPTAITIQVGRRVRTVVSALVRDPPPRPHMLIVDFDAVSPAELLELHAIRDEGWGGRLIGLGSVPLDLRASLEVDHVLATPLVRDSLLDCVAGTAYAATTVPIPAHMLAELAPKRGG
jgi:hypothetical protein